MWVAKIFEMLLDSKGRVREVCTQTIPCPDTVQTELQAVEWTETFVELGDHQFLEVAEIPIGLADEDIPRL